MKASSLEWEEVRKQDLYCALLQLILLGFKVSKNQDRGTPKSHKAIKKTNRKNTMQRFELNSQTLAVGKKHLLVASLP